MAKQFRARVQVFLSFAFYPWNSSSCHLLTRLKTMVFVESPKKFARKFHEETTTAGIISNLATDVVVTSVRPFLINFQETFYYSSRSPFDSIPRTRKEGKKFEKRKKGNKQRKRFEKDFPTGQSLSGRDFL